MKDKVSGLGELALLNEKITADGVVRSEEVPTSQIGEGVLPAGVIYSGVIKIDKVCPGKLITVAVASKKGG